MRILLLEDDFALHKAIKATLAMGHHAVESFYDGLVALENSSIPFDLYVLDINVPNVSGLEITQKIKSFNPNAKIIIISAYNDIKTIKQAYGVGCDDYLKKPFDIEELLIKVQKLDIRSNENAIIIANDLKYDLSLKILLLDNRKVELTKKESIFIHLLLSNNNRCVPYERIIEAVYPNEPSDINALRSLVKRLRKKLPDDVIKTDIVGGYVLNCKV
ncbi:MAG: response regulator transcription factor [Sulfuricurvum sp.]